MTSQRSLDVAAHEAAHVVVGVALGLRLRHATAAPVPAEGWLGYAWFPSGHDHALAIMYAAGSAWDRGAGRPWRYTADAELVRKHAPGRGGLQVCVAAAGAMLAGLGSAHARVTRALLERDLSGRDIVALINGERLEVE